MMVRKNDGQRGQRPKKAIQAICPTLPLHANLRHTHSAKAAFSPAFCQPTAISLPGPCCPYSVPGLTSLVLRPQAAQGEPPLRCYRTLVRSLQPGSSKKCQRN